MTRLAQSYRASALEKRKLVLNLASRNGLIAQAIKNGSMTFGELQSRKPRAGKIGLIEFANLKLGEINIIWDPTPPTVGVYRMKEPYASSNISIETVFGNADRVVITTGEATQGLDSRDWIKLILSNVELKSKNIHSVDSLEDFNSVHFRNTDRKSDLEQTVGLVRSRFEKDFPIYWATDDPESFTRAQKLLKDYHVFCFDSPIEKPKSFKNLHELPERLLLENKISNGDIWEHMVGDLFHLVKAREVLISSTESGWSTLVPHLRNYESKRATLFSSDGVDRWSNGN